MKKDLYMYIKFGLVIIYYGFAVKYCYVMSIGIYCTGEVHSAMQFLIS